MTIRIAWTDGEMQTIVAAIHEGAFPVLVPEVAAAIRAATRGLRPIVLIPSIVGSAAILWARRRFGTVGAVRETGVRVTAGAI